ncbi:MAG: response regulator [Desulfobacterales bacterium]|jgi:DNA-binding response OmpR family regulator
MNKPSSGPKDQIPKSDPARPVVLLVDDNALNLQMLHQTLQGLGYRLLSAKSGEDALRIAQQVLPDLILLDIMMPGIDGYETCSRLKENEATQNSVIIFLTALHDTREKVRGLSLGAVDFITKPFEPDEVIARVSRQLEVHRQHKAVLAQNQQLASQLENTLRSGPTDLGAYRQKIKSLISGGESDRLEFKSTLRWNLKTNRSEKGIEKAWLKSVVAFLNTDGGVLLVGVADDGDILGIEADQFDNQDKYLLHVNNCLQQHIGLEHSGFIRFQLIPVEEKQVLLIECQPSPSAAFLKIGKDEDFFVRVGPGSRRLSTSEVLSYMAKRKLEGQ